jgi:hypothetical protein
VITSEDAVTAL